MKVAVFGSRGWHDIPRVIEWVQKLAVKHPHAIVVSDAGRSVGYHAEQAAIRAGLRVASLRVEKHIRHIKIDWPPRLAPAEDPDNLSAVEQDRYEVWWEAQQAAMRAQSAALHEWVIVLYEMQPDKPMAVRPLTKVYDDKPPALAARARLIAELADFGVAFTTGASTQASQTINEFVNLDKKAYLTVFTA